MNVHLADAKKPYIFVQMIFIIIIIWELTVYIYSQSYNLTGYTHIIHYLLYRANLFCKTTCLGAIYKYVLTQNIRSINR